MPTKRKAKKFVISEWEKIGDIKETRTLKVSARGSGLCVILPKDLCEIYGVISKDRIKMTARDLFRKRRSEDEEVTANE